MKYFKYRYLALITMLSIFTCCTQEKQVDSDASEMEEPEELTNRINIPAIVRSNLGITFAKVERRNVQNAFRVPGSFELLPLAKHEQRMMVSGHIDFLVDQFDKVEQGTPLYRFKSIELLGMMQKIELAKAELKQASDKYELAKERQTDLKKANYKRADLDAEVAGLNTGVTQKKAVLSAAESLFSSIAETMGVEANFEKVTNWIEVRASEAGVVSSLAVTNGAFVEGSSLILTTIDAAKVRFRAMALQSDISRFKDGQKVNIVSPQSGNNDINDSIPAELKIGLTADATNRTITLFAKPSDSSEDRAWARSGISAFLEIAEESTDGIVLAIPKSAVVRDGLTHVFFKRDPLDPNKAIRVEADLGVSDGRWIEIMSELGPNDEVVLNGVYELKLASEQGGKTQKGGHFHADGTYHGKDD